MERNKPKETTVSLTYEVHADRSFPKDEAEEWIQVFSEVLEFQQLRLTVSNSCYLLQFDESLRYACDLRTKEVVLSGTLRGQNFAVPLRGRSRRQMPRTAWTLIQRRAGPQSKLGSHQVRIEHFIFTSADYVVEIDSTDELPELSALVFKPLRDLLGIRPSTIADIGVPLKIVIYERGQSADKEAVSLNLVDIDENGSAEDIDSAFRIDKAQYATESGVIRSQQKQSASDAQVQQQSLMFAMPAPNSSDFSILLSNKFLDTVRGLVNRLSIGLDGLRSEEVNPETLRLRVFFDDILQSTDLDPILLEKVITFMGIMQNVPSEAFGLSGDRAATYESDVRTVPDVLARFITFGSLIYWNNTEEIHAAIGAHYANRLRFDIPVPRRHEFEAGPLLVRFTINNVWAHFTPLVLIKHLEFTQHEIRADLFVEQLQIHGFFRLDSNPGALKRLPFWPRIAVKAILEIVLGNEGPGYFNIDDLTLSLGLAPTDQPGSLRYRVRVDKSRSSMDLDFAGFGPNPVGTTLLLIFSFVSSWLDAFEDDLYDAIQKMLDGVDGIPVFQFPDIWNAENPPAEERLRESFPQIGNDVLHMLEGHSPSERTNLFTNTNIQSLRPPASSDYLYAASQRYLTNWIRQHTRGQEFFNITELPLNIAPTLPDPSTVPEPASKKQTPVPLDIDVDIRSRIDPETGTVFARPQCHKPTDPPNEYMNRFRFTRSLSKVEMPADGPSPIAGTMVMEYEFSVEAVRFEYQYRLAGYTQGRCILVPAAPGIDTSILAQRGWTPLKEIQSQGRIISTPISGNLIGDEPSAFSFRSAQGRSTPSSLSRSKFVKMT